MMRGILPEGSTLLEALKDVDTSREDVFWVDFSSASAGMIWRKWWSEHVVFPGEISEIRALVPKEGYKHLDWAFIYQALCDLHKLQKLRALSFVYLIVTGNSRLDRVRARLFAKSKGIIKPPGPGVFRYHANIFYPSRKRAEVSFANEVSQTYLKRMQSEERQEAAWVPERWAKWRRGFQKTLSGRLEEVNRTFVQTVKSMDFAIPRDNFGSHFGDGRKDSFGALFENLCRFPESSENNQQLEVIFLQPINPLRDLTAELSQLRDVISNFYVFPIPDTDPFPPGCDIDSPPRKTFAYELCATGSKTQMSGGRGNDAIQPRIEKLFGDIGNGIGRLTPKPAPDRGSAVSGADRRAVKHELKANLSELHTHLSEVVRREVGLLSSDAEILQYSPRIFQEAYNRFYTFFFSGFMAPIIPALWRTRRFVFPIGGHLPGPFFKHFGLLKPLLEALLQGLILLNVYRFLGLSLTLYRKERDLINQACRTIRDLSERIHRQAVNITEELNLKAYHAENVMVSEYADALLDSRVLSFIEAPPEDPNKIIQDSLDRVEKQFPGHLQTIKRLLEESFAKEFHPSPDFYKHWVPAVYNQQDAWRIADEMISSVLNDQTLRRFLPENEIPEGICVHENFEGPLDVGSCEDWLIWKKKGLCTVSEPFQHDACRVQTHADGFSENRPADMLANWRKTQYIDQKEDRVKLNPQAYRWLEPEFRSFFFQRSQPLSKPEFISRMDSHAYKGLKTWLYWVCTRLNVSNTRNILQQTTVEPLDSRRAGALFDFIVQNVPQHDTRADHPFFGVLDDRTAGGFLLNNTLDAHLMFFFRPGKRDNAAPRTFPINFFLSALGKDRALFEALNRAFQDFCLCNSENLGHMSAVTGSV